MELTPESIGRSMEHIALDGSSWLVPNKLKEYHDTKILIINALKYDIYWDKISSNNESIKKLKKWKSETSDWERILTESDVAMFPPVLKKMKIVYMTEIDKEISEAINQLSYCSVNNRNNNARLYHNSLLHTKAESGVFRLRCVIGDNMFKQLRRHLKVTEEEFKVVYGQALYENHDFVDELLIEMLVTGRLTGAIRNYKIEKDYYD